MIGKIAPARVDNSFMKELKEIKLERIRRGVDKEFKSDRRLTKAIVRSSLWRELKEVLINSPIENDTKFRGRKFKSR